MEKPFAKQAIVPENPKYDQCIQRNKPLIKRPGDVRTPFGRDYTRILHTRAYSRLKHKTQVFFATRNDHICTRMEHVNHVSSISTTICKHLGLNEELAMAISNGHDLGHSPFGHTGERIISAFAKQAGHHFFHEKNSLRFVDDHETLQDANGCEQNLYLSYGVRDGILLHCGEVLDKTLKPRDSIIELEKVTNANQYPPFTWEGCVVKISDIIAYIGRDIEDALRLQILDKAHQSMLDSIITKYADDIDIKKSNNTSLIHHLVHDLCVNSSLDEGLHFSSAYNRFAKDVIDFNYAHIYENPRLVVFQNYAQLILESLFELLMSFYKGNDTYMYIQKDYLSIYPQLCATFGTKLLKYSNLRTDPIYQNKQLYSLDDQNSYVMAVIDYLSSLTDIFAIKLFEEITSF